jgi:signal peptidase I
MATPTPPTPAPEPAPADTAHWAVEWAKSIGFAVVVWLLLRTFLFEAFRIPSPSMERTLLIGDFLFVNKAVYGAHVPFTEWHLPKFRDPERSDLVIFDSVEDGVTKVVKRVMGVEGDTLEMRDRVIYRNGVRLDEPYAQYVEGELPDPPARRDQIRRWQSPHLIGRDTVGYWPDRNNWGPVVIPQGHLFVMGDNRELSWDGRFWGFLPRQNIRGTPLFIYYTFDGNTYKPLPFLTNIRWGRFFTVPR